jgi:membrane-associated phospholipid phosphatase
MLTQAKGMRQIVRRLIVAWTIVSLLLVGSAGAAGASGGDGHGDGNIEPQAGTWHTWLLTSGSQLRPAAPPSVAQTQVEIKELKQLAQQRDEAALDRIAYWNTGAPVYRWNDLALQEIMGRSMNVITGGRALALFHAAISDATVATWDAKYAYNRPRPGDFNRSLRAAIETPNSPSYPSEHAATAGAASEVLAYLFPDRADFFRAKAVEAGETFLIAGTQYRSDVEAGLELGRQVGQLAVARAKTDGSDAKWDGKMPSGDGYWTGQNPIAPMLGTWKTWALASGSEFRPGPPPAYDSAALAAEMDELRNFQRTPATDTLARYWEYGSGGAQNHVTWNEQLGKKVLEYRLDDNPPQVARAYALESIAFYDAAVACWDAKYTYWAWRPFQYAAKYNLSFQPLFATPNHPGYPSAHSCLSGAAADILAYLFPREGSRFVAMAEQAGEARIWAGIHFRSDIAAGQDIAHKVAQKVIEVAR